MICMQRTFGQPVIVPPGNTARSIAGVDVGAQAAAHVRDDVMHVRVALDRHELVDLARCPPRRRARGRCARGRSASRARPAPWDEATAPRSSAASLAHRGRAAACRRSGAFATAVAHRAPAVPATSSARKPSQHCARPRTARGWPRKPAIELAGSTPARSVRAPAARQVGLVDVARADVFERRSTRTQDSAAGRPPR